MERLDALGDGELRRALLFVRGHPLPVTAADVADALDVPRTVARWRLEKLTAAGLLVTRFERRGAGRPAKTYAPAPETAQVEFPRRRYELLAALLVRALPRRRRPQELHEVGAAFGAELAHSARIRPHTDARRALERLCRGLGELGFHAAPDEVTATGAVICSATCPLRPLVAAEPETRALDEGMWQGLVEASLGRVAGVVCRTHDCLDGDASCRIVVSY